MVRDKRGGKIQGDRAKGKGSEEKKRAGRKSEEKYTLRGKAAKQAEDTPCIARGNHDKNCICNGTGWIKTTK